LAGFSGRSVAPAGWAQVFETAPFNHSGTPPGGFLGIGRAALDREVDRFVDRSSEQMGPTRSRLIDKGLLYTPGHGLAAFTVPQFDRFMHRTYPLQ
jgi:hypothetical protein